VAGGGQNGVDAVAVAAFEMVATHAVIVLEMADDLSPVISSKNG
jgi:NAD(P)H-hydrate repair Nnr-like enzyme with NAD(P)H-hydrate epimerase domain